MREFNIQEIDRFFKINGFKIIYPEKISLDEMIFYINNCEVCAVMSGTLPHNALFTKDNLKLFIIERNVANNEFQVDINKMKNCDVQYIEGCVGVFPADVSGGPFILGYTDYMNRFASDNGYKPIHSKLNNPLYFRRIIKKYMNEYFYCNRTYPEYWLAVGNYSLFKEAYDNSQSQYNFLPLRYYIKKKIINILINIKKFLSKK